MRRIAFLAVSVVVLACRSSESDPSYQGSPSAQISSQDVSHWNQAYQWGDHAAAGYLQAEADPVFSAAPASAITSDDVSRWNAAFAFSQESIPKIGPLQAGAVPRWDGNQLAAGMLTDTGSAVGVGTATPAARFEVWTPTNEPVLDQASLPNGTVEFISPQFVQTFTAGITGKLAAVDLVSAMAETLTLTLQDQSGAALASTTCSLPGHSEAFSCAFSNPGTITAGTVYSLVLALGSGISLTFSSADTYAGGSSNLPGGIDLVFRTWVVPAGDIEAFSVGTDHVSVGAVFHLTPLRAAPPAAKEGDLYFDATLHRPRYFNGTSWVSM